MITLTRIFNGTANNEVLILGQSAKFVLISVTPLETNGNTPQFPEFVIVKQQINVNGEIIILTEQSYPIDSINHLMYLPSSIVYDLLVIIPEWYSSVELKISNVDGLNYDPANPGSNVVDLTNYYDRNEIDLLLALKAAIADIPNISGKADIDHNHDDLYYRIDDINALIDGLTEQIAIASNSGGSLKNLCNPAYAISSHPNGNPQWGGPMAGAFDPTANGVWNAPDGANNVWIGQAFPSPVKIKEVRFRTGYGQSFVDEQRVIRQYRIESTNDLNGTWVNYGLRYTQSAAFSQFLTVINEPELHQYWRIFIVQGSSAFVAGIGDIQFLG